jgi:SAM-dependent methyltransferase
MKWFSGQRHGDESPADDAPGPSQPRKLYVPGAPVDESLEEGPGFVLLGGAQPSAGTKVLMDDVGHGYIALDGRSYRADIPDILPKDEREARRLDFQHHLIRQLMQGNYAAPVMQPTSILDAGCGPGRWTMEVAALFPAANVVGFDILPPLAAPAGTKMTDNVAFVAGDLLQPMPFAGAAFDFVHMRLLFTAIPAASWPAVVRELLRVTRPGGWLELMESGLPRNGPPEMETLNRWAREVAAHRGIDLDIGARIGAFLRAAGIVNVAFHEFDAPVGRIGGRSGQMNAADAVAFYESLRPLILAEGVTSSQTFDQALAAVRADAEYGSRPCVRPFYLAYAQRGS